MTTRSLLDYIRRADPEWDHADEPQVYEFGARRRKFVERSVHGAYGFIDDHYLLSDGSRQMAPDYEPQNRGDIATRGYVRRVLGMGPGQG